MHSRGGGVKLPDSVNDGIVASIRLREEWGPNSRQRTDVGASEDARVVDYQIWRPSDEPQWNSHQGDLNFLILLKLDFYRFNFGPFCLFCLLTFASFASALCALASADLNEATFIFFACSLIFFSWAETAWKITTISSIRSQFYKMHFVSLEFYPVSTTFIRLRGRTIYANIKRGLVNTS